VIKWFTTILGSIHKDTKVVNHLLLSAEILKSEGAKCIFEILLPLTALFSYIKVILHRYCKDNKI